MITYRSLPLYEGGVPIRSTVERRAPAWEVSMGGEVLGCLTYTGGKFRLFAGSVPMHRFKDGGYRLSEGEYRTPREAVWDLLRWRGRDSLGVRVPRPPSKGLNEHQTKVWPSVGTGKVAA